MLASLLMLSDSTADRIGRRRMFQYGLGPFSLASPLCALAPSLGMLSFAEKYGSHTRAGSAILIRLLA